MDDFLKKGCFVKILFGSGSGDGAVRMARVARMFALVLLSFVLALGGLPPVLAEAYGAEVSDGEIETPSVAAASATAPSATAVSQKAVAASIAVAGGLLPLDVAALGQTIIISTEVTAYVAGNSSTSNGFNSDLSPVGNRLVINPTGVVNRDAWGAQGNSSGYVNNNAVDIYGKVVYDNVYGGQTSKSGSVTYNTVNVFPNGLIGGVTYGGCHEVAGGSANFNTVNVYANGKVVKMIYGGKAPDSADNNTVNVNGITDAIYGGCGLGVSGHANNNKVTIGDGALVQNPVHGGAGKVAANNNVVEITGGTMTSTVYAGYSEGTQANNNTVIVSGNPTIKGIVMGGYTPKGTGSNNILIKNSPAYMPELWFFQTVRFGYSGNSNMGGLGSPYGAPEIVFDTGSNNIVHSSYVNVPNSRFVKKGTGTLTLTPTATLRDMDIIVSEGTLRLTSGTSLSLPFSATRGHIVVNSGATLIVDEGVNISMAGGGKVTVGGRLENRGTFINNASGGIVVEGTGTLVNDGRITINGNLGVLTMNGTYAGSKRVYFNCYNVSDMNLNGSNAKSVPMTISIIKTKINNRDILAQKYLYDGKAKEPYIRIGTSTLLNLNDPILGVNYSLRYENNINVGKAKVIISGIEPSWYDSYSEEFTISPADIATTAIASNPACAYTGKPVAMKSVLTYNGMTLVNGRDYTVSYANNTELGEATATLTGTGNYTGTKTVNFSIVPKEAIPQPDGKDGDGANSGEATGSFRDGSGKDIPLSISGLKNRAWTGKQIKPAVTVKAENKTLKSGRDYTVSYGANKNIGKGSLTIKGKGNYSGTNTLTFRIVPKKLTGLKVTAGKTSLKVSWKKAGKAQKVTGYQIQYRIAKNGKWTAKTASAKTSKLTLKNLKKGKHYQLRIRAYKTVSKVKYFSAWRNTKGNTLK